MGVEEVEVRWTTKRSITQTKSADGPKERSGATTGEARYKYEAVEGVTGMLEAGAKTMIDGQSALTETR